MTDYQAFYEKHLGKIKWGKGGEGLARCPFHDDQHASLSVNRDKGVWFCHACNEGGTAQDFARRRGVEIPNRRRQDPEAIYYYPDRAGKPIYRIVRGPGKKFWAERPDGKGGWVKGIEGITLVPYRLPEVLRAEGFVYIVEGEKDVETLRTRGLTATTNPFGAGKWKDEFSQYLEGMNVIIFPDNDEPGERHAQEVHASLYGKATGVLILEIPGLGEKEDVTDWLNKGHTTEELLALVREQWDKAAVKGKLKPPTVTTAPKVEAQIEDEASQEDLIPPPFPRELLVWPYDELMGIVERTTDCDPAALFLGIHVALGVGIGRAVRMMVGSDIYPIDWALMVGPPYISRKSVPIYWSRSIASGLCSELKTLNALGSIERASQVLDGKDGSRLLIGASEFAGTLAASLRPGTSNLVSDLCSLYDHRDPFDLGTKASKPVNYYVVGIIAGTTRDGLMPFLRQHHLTGGLFSRFLPVLNRRGELKTNPPPPDYQAFQDTLDKILKRLETYKAYGKLIALSSGTADFWDEWVKAWDKDLRAKPDHVIAGVGRFETHVRKAALLRAALEQTEHITLGQVEWAIKVGGHYQRHAEALLKEIGLSTSRQIEERILVALKKAPQSVRHLQRSLNDAPTARVMRSFLEAMAAAGMVELQKMKGGQNQDIEIWALPGDKRKCPR